MRYHNITKDDMLNGHGLRVVLWLSGCNHYCKGCHNQITWDALSGLEFDEAAETELFSFLEKPYTSGITLSGGDPLFPANREEVTALIAKIRTSYPDKTIWLYTGFLWEEICDLDLIKNLDVLVDGEFVEDLHNTTLHWVGSSNQRIIDVPKTLAKGEVVLVEK